MSSTKQRKNTSVKQSSKKNWKKHLLGLCNQDIKAKRNEYYFPAPDWLTNLLQIPKDDRPLFYCLFNVGVSIIINLLLLPFLMNCAWYYIALITMIRFVLLGLPRFMLALHFSAHKPIIKPNILNKLYIECFCCSFYGLPPGVYRFHHIVMHHKEDNIHPLDLSSTMPYQRDNIFHFLHYWARFEFGIWVELPYYLFKKGYYKMFCEALFSMALWWIVNYYVWNIRPAFSLWLFLMPQFLVSFLLMFGNFSQHMFVEPKHYEDDHQLTINLINTPYNQLTFNDGYHIIHHKYPQLHWTQLPKTFISDRELEKHGNADAIILNNIDYFVMGIYIVTGNLKKLATHFVPCSEKQSKYTIDDIVKLFKRRLPPIPRPEDIN